jgi:hypothetical protein
MEKQTWREKFEAELTQAQAARVSGNEGMARVCSRRAAGIAIGEYLERRNIILPKTSAYDRLKFLLSDQGIPIEVRVVLEHFLARIDTDHNLPVDADLISEARWLADTLITSSSIADRPDDRNHHPDQRKE